MFYSITTTWKWKVMVMNQIIQYIELHLEDDLSIKQLADVAGYSEYYFIRLFKSYTNQTVMEYICRRRLIKSCDDILSGMRLIDVAMKYGRKSHSAFSKSFNREIGFSPSLLRTMKTQLDCLGGSYMNQIFLKATEVGAGKEKLFELLKDTVYQNAIEIDDGILNEVYLIACKAYEGKRRYSGEEYVTHPLNVAILLAELGAESDTVLAGLFCDVKTKGNSINLEKELPANVWNIVNLLEEKKNDEAIVIKLAERLHNMRTIDFIDNSKKAKKVKETIEIYLPLARQINNQKLIDELNDLAMKYNV